MKILFVVFVTAGVLGLGFMGAADKSSVETLAPDCSLWSYSGVWRNSPQEVQVLIVDISSGNARLELDSRDNNTLPQYHASARAAAKSRGGNFVATVNGNVAGCIGNGQIVSAPDPLKMTIHPGPQYYFGYDGEKFFIRPLELKASAVGTPAPGVVFALCSLPYYSAPLVWEGQAYDHTRNYQHQLTLERHPRTIAGVSADGKKVFLVLIKGRGDTCAGMTFEEASAFLLEHFPEINSAINLDGGYSSMLMINGRDLLRMIPLVDARQLPNVLHVFAKN